MKLKLRDRRPAHSITIRLNRSTKLEGKAGKYAGRDIKSRYVTLPHVKPDEVRL